MKLTEWFWRKGHLGIFAELNELRRTVDQQSKVHMRVVIKEFTDQRMVERTLLGPISLLDLVIMHKLTSGTDIIKKSSLLGFPPPIAEDGKPIHMFNGLGMNDGRVLDIELIEL